MKTTAHLLTLLAFSASTAAHAQFDFSHVQYWVGAGADSSVLVVDFQDGTDDASYAWGWLHNGGTGEDMLNAIAAADVNFSIDLTGGFLNSATYGSHAGIGGSPDYWSTWSGTSFATLGMNMGASEEVGNGDWFACSYTDFSPALEPTEPIAAMDPFGFTAADVNFWVGSGTDTTLLVVDFQDGSGASSFAWGYLHDAGVTAETMLNDIAAADPEFAAVTTGGFLGDVTYGDYAGIGGEPNYWSTWSGTNLGDWSMNMGISTELENGGFFGCSYTDFFPAIRPGFPTAASFTTGVTATIAPSFNVWPQPATDLLNVSTELAGQQEVIVYNMAGTRVYQGVTNGTVSTIDVRSLSAGMYVLQLGTAKRLIAVQ